MAKILDSSGNDRTSDSRPPEDDNSGLGELLRRARERRGLTLEQISNETKIPRRHLEALERDNLAAVPGGFYRRAQLRTFARAVNLDQGIALARLERLVGAPAAREAATDTPAAHAAPFSRKHVLIMIGVGVAAAVFVQSIGRPPLPADRDGRDTAAADSLRQVASGGPDGIGDALVAVSQRTPLDAVATQPAVSEGSSAVAMEPPEAPVPAGSSGDAAATAEPARPAAATAITELVVATEPPGARVTVDGIGWGSSPATIRFLPAGSKRIRVIKEGYSSEERVVSLVEGRRSTLAIQLRDEP